MPLLIYAGIVLWGCSAKDGQYNSAELRQKMMKYAIIEMCESKYGPPISLTIEKLKSDSGIVNNDVFKIAVNTMTEAAEVVLKQAGLTFADVDLIIPHQANVRIIMAMAKRLGLPAEKIFLNIEKYGNMSSASTATALCEAVKAGRIKKGDIILLDAFGAGLVWGACLIKW